MQRVLYNCIINDWISDATSKKLDSYIKRQNGKNVNLRKEVIPMATGDRRVKKTKKAISEAFWQLMQTKDFDEITVNDVAQKAEISRTTFFTILWINTTGLSRRSAR